MNVSEINLFPFPFPQHLIFCCISLVFFVLMFIKYKKPYQLIMAIAIPFSLIVWISNSRTVFYAMGIIELVFIAAALISNIIYKIKHKNNGDNN